MKWTHQVSRLGKKKITKNDMFVVRTIKRENFHPKSHFINSWSEKENIYMCIYIYILCCLFPTGESLPEHAIRAISTKII